MLDSEGYGLQDGPEHVRAAALGREADDAGAGARVRRGRRQAVEAGHEAEPKEGGGGGAALGGGPLVVRTALRGDGGRYNIAALGGVVEEPHAGGPLDAGAGVVGVALGVVAELLLAPAAVTAAEPPADEGDEAAQAGVGGVARVDGEEGPGAQRDLETVYK